MIRIKNHIFRGKRYAISWKPISKADKRKLQVDAIATCEGPSSVKGKRITINPSISGIDLLRAAIDEGIHACVWELDNNAVAEMSESIAGFLWRIGFRDVEHSGKTKIHGKSK